MKKIYTLLTALAITIGANAQYDLSIAWNTLTEGSTVTTSPVDLSFTVTNSGTTTITAEDSIIVAMNINGNSFKIDFTALGNTVLNESLAPGESFSVDVSDQVITTGSNGEFCAVVFGLGAASFPSMLGDIDDSNNSTCVDILIDENIEGVGINDLESSLTNVYVAAGEILLVNDAVNTNKPAELKIINLNGQTVQSSKFIITEGTTAITLNNIATGIYVVAINIEGDVVTRKVVIQ